MYLLLVVPVMAEYYRHSADLQILVERQGHHPLRKECPGQGDIFTITIHPFINKSLCNLISWRNHLIILS